jgi:hypothetical protein
MLKRKFINIELKNEAELTSKFQKLNLNPKIKRNFEYYCLLHDNDVQICKIYDCCGFQNKDNLIKKESEYIS